MATASHTPNDAARADIYKTQVVLAYSAGTSTEHLTPIKVTLAKTQNMHLHDGQSCPFDIVPFPDGSMPNAPPHNLPPLTSAATIAGLNPGQLNAYCNGYVGVGHGLVGAARQTAIAWAIGCTVTP
ncbi:hypothetical protein V8B97DRAFT_700212 [Scleroderma yunnanense]